MPRLILDARSLEFEPGTTLLRLALAHDLYIPTLCFHPDLPPAEGRSWPAIRTPA
jgi:NADH dehydrogenase/NADH:ubiquinone oxidoreductase subunit G